jgi:soluble lytic murein transglycosylase
VYAPAAMRGIDQTLSRLPAALALIAGAAILAGATVPTASAQSSGRGDGDETAMAVPFTSLPGASEGVAWPRPLSPSDAVLVHRIFVAQLHGDLAQASRETDQLEDRLLLGHILADRYLGSFHRSTAPELTDWLDRFGDQPDAPAIYALLRQRLPSGAPLPPAPASLTLPNVPTSIAGRHEDDAVDIDTVPIQRNEAFDRAVLARANDGDDEAALRLIDSQKGLDAGYRALLRAEVARVLFTQNRDLQAQQIAETTLHNTPADRQVALAGLIAGLSAWRRQQPDVAVDDFVAASKAPIASVEQHAAGAFWAARASRRIGDPIAASYWLRQAAKLPLTFHGLIAQRALQSHLGANVDRETLAQADVDAIAATPQGQRAFALLQVGQQDRAAAELCAVWPTAKNNPTLVRALRLVAFGTGLVDLAAQLSALADVNAARAPNAAMPPVPPLRPAGGFRVDPTLVYALTRVESNFDNGSLSNVGARGLMQIMPDTARSITGNPSLDSEQLRDPAFNLALGQRYLAYLTTLDGIGTNLIRVLASYNNGPTRFVQWNGTIQDEGDPLLFIEAIPYPETRAFVRRSLTYAWIYADRLGRRPIGLDALVVGEFPSFTDAAPQGTLAMAPPRIH